MKRRPNRKLLSQYAGMQPCWWCGWTKLCQAHHLVTKGMGGSRRADVPLNLMSLCIDCHYAHHTTGRPSTEKLAGRVAVKNGVAKEVVDDAMDEIKWGKL